jgi:hypothetical protein
MQGCASDAGTPEGDQEMKELNEPENLDEDGPHANREKVKKTGNFQLNRKPLLRNGNPQGNPNDAPRCGAKTRKGMPCRAPAMANGRCRLHGGRSIGPRTPEGLERCRRANWKHGRYSKDSPARWANRILRECREVRRRIRLELNLK